MTRYAWARWGDVNAFFGLMLDNVAVMVILVSSIASPARAPDPSKFDSGFVLTHMIPGTALGVLLGDLVYTWMAFRLARRTGRANVTAMPLGLDTPSTFGVAFLVLIPTLNEAQKDLHMDHQAAMEFAWRVAVVVLVLIGIFKVICAPLGNAVRRLVPQAGLLGSLAAIALALIAFLPLLLDGIAAVPIVGMVCLTIILVTLVAHRSLPGRIPGALAAVIVGVVLYLGCAQLGNAIGLPLVPPLAAGGETPKWEPPHLLAAFFADYGEWKAVWLAALVKLPVAIPFGLATIVGGIDCTESAATAGDEYDTRTILLTEGVASVIAAVLGGVIQTTPYIGHPAYKKMDAGAAYTLATALFVGAAGYFGWFTLLFDWLPRAALFPILVFVGLEITAQSFHATPQRHYPAVAIAMLPALAYLGVVILVNIFPLQTPGFENGQVVLLTLRCLGNGFIVTSLLWAAALAAMIDGQYARSAVYLLVAGACALFGVIHSPFADATLALPHNVFAQLAKEHPIGGERFLTQSPYHWAGAYALAAGLLLMLRLFATKRPNEPSRP
jgi:AGZA family xanthine/uracil permease-like MFS transporter